MCAPLLHFHTRSLFYLSEKKRASTEVARTSQALVLFLVVHAEEAPTFPYHIIQSLIHSRNVFLSNSYFPGPVIGTKDTEIRHRTGPQGPLHLDGDTHVSRRCTAC